MNIPRLKEGYLWDFDEKQVYVYGTQEEDHIQWLPWQQDLNELFREITSDLKKRGIVE